MFFETARNMPTALPGVNAQKPPAKPTS